MDYLLFCKPKLTFLRNLSLWKCYRCSPFVSQADINGIKQSYRNVLWGVLALTLPSSGIFMAPSWKTSHMTRFHPPGQDTTQPINVAAVGGVKLQPKQRPNNGSLALLLTGIALDKETQPIEGSSNHLPSLWFWKGPPFSKPFLRALNSRAKRATLRWWIPDTTKSAEELKVEKN